MPTARHAITSADRRVRSPREVYLEEECPAALAAVVDLDEGYTAVAVGDVSGEIWPAVYRTHCPADAPDTLEFAVIPPDEFWRDWPAEIAQLVTQWPISEPERLRWDTAQMVAKELDAWPAERRDAQIRVEGEPAEWLTLGFHETQLRVPAAAAIAGLTGVLANLAAVPIAGDTSQWRWDIRGGIITIAGRVMVVTAVRMCDMIEMIDELFEMVPELQMIEAHELPMDSDTFRIRAEGARVDPDHDPAMTEFLEQHTRRFERRWVNIPLMTLGGRTPRQAATDTDRRKDLDQLLRAFIDLRWWGGRMSEPRLRHYLDLDA